MIDVSSLTYSYAPDKTLRFPDFRVDKGKACLLLGNSGSGKTTLLHLLGGLLKVQHGKVLLAGENVADLSESARDKFRGRNIGFIFQRNHLISALSVYDNLSLARYLANLPNDEGRVSEVLERLGLTEKQQANVKELSQGQAQRVAIARAVLNKPAVILADEPTSALDDDNCHRVINLLLEISSMHASTLVIATHDQRLKSMIPLHVQIHN